MASTQLGQTVNTQPGANTNITTDSATHIIIREMPKSYAQRPISQHPGYEASVTVNDLYMAHSGTVISYETGDMATVTYTYGGGGEIENQNGGGGSNTPGTTYSLDVATEAVSILRHERYRLHISDSESLVLGRMLQQGPTDSDGNDLSSGLTGTEAIECADKIKSGIVSFESPCYIWRKTVKSGSWTPPANFGKTSEPQGPSPNIDGDWLFIGMTASGGDNTLTEVSYTWKSSVSGDGWDDELYGS